jgi:3-hydroxyacyl-CoA dehydrogenase
MEKKDNSSRKKEKGITRDDVEILIVGAGTMGASLTQAYAQSGFNVGLIDISGEILERALDTIARELDAARKSGIFSESQVTEIKSRILTTTSYESVCKGKSLRLAIETATEDIEIKKEIFRKLDNLCAPGVVLASNSSSLDINALARETKRPDKVVWMHFFYLPHKNRAGEYAGTENASPRSIEMAAKYMKLAGKVATPILSSRKGGAADVIFVALLLEATRMLDEGYDIPSIEAAGTKAFDIPMGFLSLMDHTGIPLGIVTMYSFSESSNPDDPLFKAYNNFFAPSESYKKFMEKYNKAEDKSAIKWVSEEEAKKEPKDLILVDMLKNRFLAVAFMTATEVVGAGVVEMDEVDKLCRTAFLWKEGPFSLMNKMGISRVMQIVTERMELSHRNEINFPVPELLIRQAQENKPWPVQSSPIIFALEKSGTTARIAISNLKSSNALDPQAFEDLRISFDKANKNEEVDVIIFDSAPIKTFIAGASVSDFIRYIRQRNFEGLKEAVAVWQDTIFHRITGQGKAKIAIMDGAALGGGAELGLAFALDADSMVIATERTSFAFPETRIGFYPVLRGTLTLPQVIFNSTGDSEMALALSRYYILGGGIKTSSSRIIKHLGMADFLVPSHKRDEVAEVLVKAIVGNGAKPLTPQQKDSLKIDELPSELTLEEKEELHWMKDLFLRKDLIPTLYACSRGEMEVSLSGERKKFVEKIARWVAYNSPHAVRVAYELISQGFQDFLEGKSLDGAAKRELDDYLIPTFQHPDALEGLTALVERRTPAFQKN